MIGALSRAVAATPAAQPVAVGVLAALRRTSCRAGLVVMQHRVAERGGDPRFDFVPALSRSQFEAQLEFLERYFDVVPAGQVLAAASARTAGEPFPVAITFDDDTDTHVEVAAPALRRRGLPATFFLNGIALPPVRRYWWELMQVARDRGVAWVDLVPDATLETARTMTRGGVGPYPVSAAVQRMDPAARAAMVDELTVAYGDGAPGGLTPDEIRSLTTAGCTVGWHGFAHEPMSLLEPDALERELDEGRTATASAAAQELRLIAYPYGWADARVAEAARARGFTGGFTTEPRAVRAGDDPLLLGRVDGCTPSLGAFAMALAAALLRRG